VLSGLEAGEFSGIAFGAREAAGENHVHDAHRLCNYYPGSSGNRAALPEEFIAIAEKFLNYAYIIDSGGRFMPAANFFAHFSPLSRLRELLPNVLFTQGAGAAVGPCGDFRPTT
jgi:hypothetical protein